MSFVQRILYAIRALTEEEEEEQLQRKRRRRRRHPRSSRVVALVITFQELFSSKNIGHVLDAPRRKPEKPFNFPLDLTIPLDARLTPSGACFRKGVPSLLVALPTDKRLKAGFRETPPSEEDRVLASSEASLVNSVVALPSDLKFTFPKEGLRGAPSPEGDRVLASSEAFLLNKMVALPRAVKQTSSKEGLREVPPAEVHHVLTQPISVVALTTDAKMTSPKAWLRETLPNEGERVLASSEVSLVNTMVALPKYRKLLSSKEWHQETPPLRAECGMALSDASPVVENAINSVREEQLKKKRKLKFLRFKFC